MVQHAVEVPQGGFWTAKQVAEAFNVSEAWVWKQVRINDGFPFIRLGVRAVRFDPRAVMSWVQRHSHGETG